MGDTRRLLIICTVLIAAAILIPTSPVHHLAVDYAVGKAEARWGISVIRNRIRINLIGGTVTLSDLLIQTPEKANPSWRLSAKNATLSIGYLPWFRNGVIDTLFLDGVDFKQTIRETARAESPGKKHVLRKVTQNIESGTAPGKRMIAPGKININHLRIRNGSFEYIRIDATGAKNRVTANQISIVRKNIFLDKRPDEFIRSLLGAPMKF